ncbi:MAG: hypothetical protein JWN85_2737 [Gammaproteobacteria bacterium]|nr:hypothetical protein [Gammaproteobacteria bacterium]
MRVLLADQDQALLTAIKQSLGEHFDFHAVSNKADCLDLLRVNQFAVIVAGERLEDGSGLELLGQLVKHRPNMLRVFASERERLKLLKGRLGPFGLFRTLSYPIELRQLLAVLAAAVALQEQAEDVTNIQQVALDGNGTEERPPAAAPVRPGPATRRAPSAAETPAPTRSPSASLDQPRPKTNGLSPPRSQAPEQGARSPARKLRMGQAQRVRESATTARTQVPATKSAPRQPSASQDARRSGRTPAATGSRLRRSGHQRTDALSEASQMAIAARSRQPQRLEDTGTRRSAFLVGAGVAVVLGLMGMAFKLLYASDAPPAATTTATAPRPPIPATFPGNTLEDPHGGARAGSSQATAIPATRSSASSSVSHDARLIKHVAPEYPPAAASRGIEGVVELRFTVTKDGTVTHATIVRAEPANVFNHSAIAAVRRWKYEPKTVNGVPVEAHMQLPVQFKMNPHEP